MSFPFLVPGFTHQTPNCVQEPRSGTREMSSVPVASSSGTCFPEHGGVGVGLVNLLSDCLSSLPLGHERQPVATAAMRPWPPGGHGLPL